MAKDPNNSNNQNNPNELGTSLSDRIADIGRSAYNIPAEERELRRKAKVAREGISIYDSLADAAKNYEPIQRLNKANVNTISKAEPRIRVGTEARLDRYTQQAINEVGRAFSETSINGQIRDISGTQAGQLASAAHANSPYQVLQAKSGAIQEDINALRARAQNAAESIFSKRGLNPAAQTAIRDVDRQLNTKLQELAPINAAMRVQKQQGLDPESQMTALAMSAHNAKSSKTPEAAALIAAFEELTKAAKAGATNLDDLQKKAQGAADTLDKAEKEHKEGSNRIGKIGAFLTGAGEVGREIFLNQTNTITGNRNTAAALTNNLFDRRRAALAGDMTQLTMLTSGSLQGAQREGGVNKHTSMGTDLAIGIGGILGGIALSATGVGAAAGIPAIVAGAAGVGSAIYGATKVVNVVRGADSNSERLAEEQRQIGIADQLSHIPGAYRQRLYDFSMGARGAALEAGGGAGANFINRATGPGADLRLQRMQEARIGTEQFNELSTQGFGQQGSVFNSEQVYAARNLERTGNGSMGTNIARMGALAMAGSNNPQAGLQSVMEAAFSKSLDGSKVLSMMVENTAAMASGSVGQNRAGLDTTNASSRILSNLVNPNMENKEMAASRAATAAATLNNINSGLGTNFADMAGVSAIARATGVGRGGAMGLKQLDNATAEQLRLESARIEKLSPQDKAVANKALADRMTDSLGLGSFVGKNGVVNTQALNAGLDARSQGIFRQGTFMANIDPNTPGYHDLQSGKIGMDQIQSDPKYRQLRVKLGESSSLVGLTSQESMTRGQAGSITADATSRAAGAISGKAPLTDAQKTLDDLATRQFAEMTKEARLAAAGLDGVSKALKAINEASEGLAGKVNDKTSGDVMGSAATAAKSFEVGADTFTTGVTNFGQILNGFAKSIGVRVPTQDAKTGKR